MQQVKIKRLTLEITEDDHLEIKKRCLMKRMTIKDWIMMCVIKQVVEEKKFE